MIFTEIFKSSTIKEIKASEKCNTLFIYTLNFNNCFRYLTKFWSYLSDEEKSKAKAYYNTELSNKYIISHGVLRCILGHHTKQLPQDVEFIHNNYGKPFLKNYEIQFNITHSYSIAGYVISPNHKVGIDIELRNNDLDIQGLGYDVVFTPTEYKTFSMIKSNKKKHKFFYDLWTIKEAVVKASGQGLAYPINTIEAMKSLKDKTIVLDNEDPLVKSQWYCSTLEIATGYSGAVAVEQKTDKTVYYIEMS